MIADISTTVLQLNAGPNRLAFFVGRVLSGVVLAFVGLNHFSNADAMAGYAESKGLPAARASVLLILLAIPT
jgi:uncharacterized membrane protein YphA (DoxX/SURF4 family)